MICSNNLAQLLLRLNMLKKEDKDIIAKVLTERVGHFKCPICGKGQMSLIDGYSSLGISEDYQKTMFADKIIPHVMLVCNNCGFISHHALGTLGLLKKSDNNPKDASGDDSK